MTAAEAKLNTVAAKENEEKERRVQVIHHITEMSKQGAWRTTYYKTYNQASYIHPTSKCIWEPMDTEWIKSLGFQLEEAEDSRFVIISWGP